MPIDLANTLPIDEEADIHQEWLSRLQGNILRSHGRDHSAHVFLRFRPEASIAQARACVAALLPHVTSARQQYEARQQYRAGHAGATLFGTLSLSASGYRALGFSGLVGFEEPREGRHAADSCFLDGMQAHAEDDLADPPVSDWEAPYRERIDAMLLLAHDSRPALVAALAAAQPAMAPALTLAIEYGQVMRNGADDPIEHFGFADGRSQPLYLAADFRTDAWGRPTHEARYGRPLDHWNPFEPLQRVLRPDPFGTDADCLGSFLVFRKFEQDVRGFVAAEARLAAALGLEGAAAERAGAMVVGRFRDGSPLTVTPASGWYPAGDNDFTYDDDPRGWRCPLHAHVRRVNPRGSVNAVDGISERARRLTRRGVTYGAPAPVPAPGMAPETLPDGGVGMLFMAYQASIRRQFAFVQKHWLTAPDFPRRHAGVDPMVGGSTGGTGTLRWRPVYNGREQAEAPFGSHVRMLGGEFFFTPSLPFLQSLAVPTT